MRREAKSCLYCNKPFFTNFLDNTQKYCSIAHQKYAWKKKHWRKILDQDNARRREKARENWKEKECLYCKIRFLPDILHKYQKYCSYKCARKVYYPPKERKITRAIYYQNHKEEILVKNEEWKAKNRFGVTSKTLNKRIVLKRDNKICQVCKNPYQVIHHIKYSGKVEDLVALCRACHMYIHSKVKKPPYWIN